MTSAGKNPNFTDSASCERGVSTSPESLVTSHSNSHCLTIDLGLIGYAEAYALQKRIVAARKADAIEDVLLFCEHSHVITQGRNGKREHLLAGENVLRQKGVSLYETSRGGDITYHGPGQIVAYPILNLAAIRRDVVWYVRMLEEVMIRASADFGVNATREPGKTGIWVSIESSPRRSQRTQGEDAPEKLGAIGVHISRWVTSHGFAYNVSTDLRFFDLIVPCGIREFPGSCQSSDPTFWPSLRTRNAARRARRAVRKAASVRAADDFICRYRRTARVRCVAGAGPAATSSLSTKQ